AEGAGMGDFSRVDSCAKIEADLLPANGRRCKVDLNFKARAIIGNKLGPCLASFDPHGLQNADETPAGWQGLDPCLNKRIDEHERTAIENRNLGVVDLDHEIVDAKP